MGRSTLTHLVILQAIGLGIVAVVGSAGAIERDRNIATMRLDARDASKIAIRGTLKCPMPETNTGGACTLHLVETETGRTLRVVASNAAMRLFQSGQTQVVATGTLTGDALQVIAIRAE